MLALLFSMFASNVVHAAAWDDALDEENLPAIEPAAPAANAMDVDQLDKLIGDSWAGNPLSPALKTLVRNELARRIELNGFEGDRFADTRDSLLRGMAIQKDGSRPIEITYEEFRNTGVPVEVALGVAMTESNWRLRARSEVGASGPYQFMPGTWAVYKPFAGANVYNARDAAQGALAYLSRLGNDFFGRDDHGKPNWTFALAAYNKGECYINGLIRGTGETCGKKKRKMYACTPKDGVLDDFMEFMDPVTCPQGREVMALANWQTLDYVPRVIANSIATLRAREFYGAELGMIGDRLYALASSIPGRPGAKENPKLIDKTGSSRPVNPPPANGRPSKEPGFPPNPSTSPKRNP